MGVGAVVLLIVVFLMPLAWVVGLVLWARWLRRRASASRWPPAVGYAFAVLSALAIVYGYVLGLMAWSEALSPAADPSQKARMLAEGISEAMNCGALGFLVAIVGATWLGVWTWRWRS